MAAQPVFTIGHSTRSLEEFLDILRHFKIELVIDVRKFPSSKKFPWFNRENLENELLRAGIEYLHYSELGGFRREGYEAFSKSREFSHAINKLLKIIGNKNAAVMCAEVLWWRCHRRYIANKLVELGYPVIHIFTKEKIQEHTLISPEIKEKMKLVLFCDKKARKLQRKNFDINLS